MGYLALIHSDLHQFVSTGIYPTSLSQSSALTIDFYFLCIIVFNAVVIDDSACIVACIGQSYVLNGERTDVALIRVFPALLERSRLADDCSSVLQHKYQTGARGNTEIATKRQMRGTNKHLETYQVTSHAPRLQISSQFR